MMGIIPPGTKLTPRPDWVPAWDSLSADQKKLYTALFENFAAFFAFTDQEVGRLLDAVKVLPDAENTMVIYIVGDNGASAEGGPDGTLNEIKGLNGISTSIEEILPHLDKLGGPESEPHYPVGWAWAGNTPSQWVKQVASHLGGTQTVLKDNKPLPTGDSTVEVNFAYAGGGAGKDAAITLMVNGKKVAEDKMAATVAGRFGVDTFGIGEDSGQPVTSSYKPPFKFTGEIEKVVITLD